MWFFSVNWTGNTIIKGRCSSFVIHDFILVIRDKPQTLIIRYWFLVSKCFGLICLQANETFVHRNYAISFHLADAPILRVLSALWLKYISFDRSFLTENKMAASGKYCWSVKTMYSFAESLIPYLNAICTTV